MPEQAQFCPSCGQHLASWIRPWQEVLLEMINEWFDLDGRMLRSFRALVFKPGLLTQEYLDGRRKSWSSPFRMYLLISLLFFLVLPAILPVSEGTKQGSQEQVDNYSKAMFALLPVFALLLKLFYRGKYYTAHLVFSMHGFSAMFLAFGFLLAMESLADMNFFALALQLLIFTYMLGYALLALRRVYEESWLRSSLKLLGLFSIFLPVIAVTIESASGARILP